jgi:hypothetical protein
MQLVKTNAATFLKFMAIILFAGITFVSCKKDHVDPPASIPVEGVYSGKYGFGNDAPDTDQKYNIKAGGIFQEIGTNSGTVVGEGTWQMNGNTLTATYTIVWAPFSKYSISATFNPATGKLMGTWGSDNNSTDGGKIDMIKQ